MQNEAFHGLINLLKNATFLFYIKILLFRAWISAQRSSSCWKLFVSYYFLITDKLKLTIPFIPYLIIDSAFSISYPSPFITWLYMYQMLRLKIIRLLLLGCFDGSLELDNLLKPLYQSNCLLFGSYDFVYFISYKCYLIGTYDANEYILYLAVSNF